MKTGRIAVPRHGGRSHAFPLPGMLEPFFETGGFRRHGGRPAPGDPQETTGGQDLFLQIRAPALGHGWRRSPGHRTRRAAGGAGWGLPVCPA
jgi:hypothetical protein